MRTATTTIVMLQQHACVDQGLQQWMEEVGAKQCPTCGMVVTKQKPVQAGHSARKALSLAWISTPATGYVYSVSVLVHVRNVGA